MDFWGFEGRNEMPGDGFGLFHDPPAVPPPNPGGAAPPPPPPPPPPASADVGGAPAVPAGTGGNPPATASTLTVTPNARFNAAQGTLDQRYSGVVSIFNSHGISSGYPDAAAFREHPERLTAFWGTVRDVPGYSWPTGMDGDVTRLVGDQTTYNAVKTDMLGTATNHPADRAAAGALVGRANSVVSDINSHTLSTPVPGRGPDGAPLPEPPPDPNRPPPLVAAANAFQQGAYLGNSVAGSVNSLANIGYAGQNVGAAYGGAGAGGGIPFGGGGYGGGALGTAGYGGVGDLTGTNYAIGLSGSDNRSKGQKIDAMIQQLLAALAQGNLDVLETAITLCNQKARMTIAGAAVNTIRAMQLYDNQMKQLSDQMGALAGQSGAGGGAGQAGGTAANPTQMSAQLAQLNTQSSQISSGRQMIANNLRDLMTMQEEIGNTEKGIRDTMSRIKTTQSRWS